MNKFDKGFTLLEGLLSLFILSISLPFSVQLVSFVNAYPLDTDRLQDTNGVNQIILYMSLSENIQVEEHQILFDYQDKEYRLSNINNRIVLQPGTNILLSHIDKVSFIQENNYIYMEYQRNNDIRKVVIRYP